MENLLSQLRDIRGIDAVSWWPPAPGWWLLLGVMLFAAGIAVRVRRKRTAYRHSWQAAMKAELAALRDEDANADMKAKAAALSEVMRKLAIRRFGRAQCAGREGREWLDWLAQHDPAGFGWDKQAEILIEAPYMPAQKVKRPANWNALIEAAEKWVSVK